MEIRIEVLTPEDAREIVAATGLGDYGHREKIDGYKQWMLDGKWSLFYTGTGRRFINDPLIFRPSGELLEGKHRVIALSEVEGGLEAPFWVLRDFDDMDTFMRWIEDGEAGRRPRSVGIDAPRSRDPFR